MTTNNEQLEQRIRQLESSLHEVHSRIATLERKQANVGMYGTTANIMKCFVCNGYHAPSTMCPTLAWGS